MFVCYFIHWQFRTTLSKLTRQRWPSTGKSSKNGCKSSFMRVRLISPTPFKMYKQGYLPPWILIHEETCRNSGTPFRRVKGGCKLPVMYPLYHLGVSSMVNLGTTILDDHTPHISHMYIIYSYIIYIYISEVYYHIYSTCMYDYVCIIHVFFHVFRSQFSLSFLVWWFRILWNS